MARCKGKYESFPYRAFEVRRSPASTRQVDIAIIPAIEYQRIDGLVILPELVYFLEKIRA